MISIWKSTSGGSAETSSVVVAGLGRNLPATTASDTVQKVVELVDELPIKFGVQNTLLAAPTLDDTYSGGNYAYLGTAANFSLPTGPQTLNGWWVKLKQGNGQITYIVQGADILDHKDGHYKSSARGSEQLITREHINLVKFQLNDATGFNVGGDIAGEGSGVGKIVWKLGNVICVSVISGSFSANQNVDPASSYSAPATTAINATPPSTGVNIYSIIGQTTL